MVVRWRSSSTPYLYMPAGQLEFWSGRGRSPPDNSDKIARPCCVCNGGKLLHSFGQRVGITLCWSDIAVHANYNYTLQNKNITQRLGWLGAGISYLCTRSGASSACRGPWNSLDDSNGSFDQPYYLGILCTPRRWFFQRGCTGPR